MSISIINTKNEDVKIIKPEYFNDERGYFFESFNNKEFKNNVDNSISFVQDNQSLSKKNTLRGLHYQVKKSQAKLVRVIVGEIFDVFVDLRKSSKQFGLWDGVILSSENKLQLYIPKGFAHGYYVKSNMAIISYKTSDYWCPDYEQTIIWNDKDLAINWGNLSKPIISQKDQAGLAFLKSKMYK